MKPSIKFDEIVANRASKVNDDKMYDFLSVEANFDLWGKLKESQREIQRGLMPAKNETPDENLMVTTKALFEAIMANPGKHGKDSVKILSKSVRKILKGAVSGKTTTVLAAMKKIAKAAKTPATCWRLPVRESSYKKMENYAKVYGVNMEEIFEKKISKTA